MLSEEKIREKREVISQDKDNLLAHIKTVTENSERDYLKNEIAICHAELKLLDEILNG